MKGPSIMSARPTVRFGLTRFVWLAIAATFLTTACGPATTSPSGGATLRVVATTTVFADIVRNVAGDRAEVISIIPAGAGPEDHEPKPDDARKIADADLIVSNGVGLDDFLDRLIDAAGEATATRLVLGDGIPTIDVDGEPNPHFWLDPSLVATHYIPAISAALAKLDPTGAATYATNASAYVAKVEAMDAANRAKIDTIPMADRKLVTFHDAFPYFAAHYGFELVGIILANVGQEPTASELAALVEKVRAAHVKAVFSEAQFSPELAHTLAQEAGITSVVTTLYNDTVGPPPNDTYLKMMEWNINEIVQALR
jgi:zinc/manganese transport system substrate-binding protein/manganese/iron transport system substrate-binding protein